MSSSFGSDDAAQKERAAIGKELERKLKGLSNSAATHETSGAHAEDGAATQDTGLVSAASSVPPSSSDERVTAERDAGDRAWSDSGAAAHPNVVIVDLDTQMAEEQHLEADDNVDTDSALGSDTESMTTSLSESIYNYRKEHGRTYHAYKDGKYIFPNDEREADRLDLQHHLFRITYANQLYFAPLSNPKRVLDVGTGTGIWALDFADDHPDCQVVGTDLSPGQPTMVPPNLKFMIDDAEDLWIFEEAFDFIHARLMAGCFADWPAFFRQAYKNLEPGGWLELQDYGLPVKSFDGTHEGTDLFRWGELLCAAAHALGRPMGSDVSEQYERWMREAGFVDIQQRHFMWPTNSWPKDSFMKELGRWNQVNIIEGLEGFCLALLTRGLGWQREEVDILVAKVTKDFRDKRIHAYFPMPVTFGRKPKVGELVH